MKSKDKEYGLRKKEEVKKNKWGIHIIILFIYFIVINILLSGKLAEMTGYNPKLGGNITDKIYFPWAWLFWIFEYSNLNQYFIPVIKKYIGVNIIIAGIYIAIVAFQKRNVEREIYDLHGSARFASDEDIEGMAISRTEGAVLGYQINKNNERMIVRHDGPEHILMIAPTGSGKGVGIVIPTLLTWKHSIVVYDLKGENYALTAKWRQQYGNNLILKIDPTCNDGTATRYNPLNEIRLDTDYDVQDAQNIATIIMEDGCKGGGDDYFKNAGYSLLVAYILHTCYVKKAKGEQASLPSVAATLSDPTADFAKLMENMKETKHKNGKPHPACLQQGTSMSNMLNSDAGKQFAGIQGTIESKLGLFVDTIVAKNIEESDFKIEDLMHQDKPVSLYICIGSTDKERLKPLTKIIFSQIIRGLTKEVEYKDGVHAPKYKHKLLLLIDEFPSLGKMAIMNEAIAYLRGYGIRCLLIIQDFTQLRSDEAYGAQEAITANCGVRIALAPNTIQTAEEISKMLGTTTIQNKQVSYSAKRMFSIKNEGENISEQDTQRSLLTPDEVLNLESIHKDPKTGKIIPGEILIFITGNPAIYGEQMVHFQNEVIKARSELSGMVTVNKILELPPPLDEEDQEENEQEEAA